MERMTRRSIFSAIAVFLIAALSSFVTAIVAALMLVEAVGLLRLTTKARNRTTIAGCFAIGLGAALTPAGEPLSTLAVHAMNLKFFGLFVLLGPYVVPGMVVSAILAGV